MPWGDRYASKMNVRSDALQFVRSQFAFDVAIGTIKYEMAFRM